MYNQIVSISFAQVYLSIFSEQQQALSTNMKTNNNIIQELTPQFIIICAASFTLTAMAYCTHIFLIGGLASFSLLQQKKVLKLVRKL